MTDQEKVRAELHRMADGGAFNESFWQRLYNPSRDIMNAERGDRGREARQLHCEALQMPESTVAEKRAKRKALAKARKAAGHIRAIADHREPDPINLAWQRSVAWIAAARDAAVYIARSNAAMQGDAAAIELGVYNPSGKRR